MSAAEKTSLPPPVMRDVKTLVVGLKQDIGNAAEQVGRGADYYQAMKDYRRAQVMSQAYQKLKDWAVPAAVGAAGLKGYYRLVDLLSAK